MSDAGKGRHRSGSNVPARYGDELRDVVNSIAFDANAELTKLSMMIEQARALGARILALQTHNNDVANAGGLLTNIIPRELEAIGRRYALAVDALEKYSNKA